MKSGSDIPWPSSTTSMRSRRKRTSTSRASASYAFLNKFGQGDVWPPDEPFAEFAQQLRVHGEVLVTLLNRQRTPRLIRLK